MVARSRPGRSIAAGAGRPARECGGFGPVSAGPCRRAWALSARLPRPAPHVDHDRPAGRIVANHRHDVFHRVDVVRVDSLEHVADMNARAAAAGPPATTAVTVGPAGVLMPLMPERAVRRVPVQPDLVRDRQRGRDRHRVGHAAVADRREDDSGDVARAVDERAARRGASSKRLPSRAGRSWSVPSAATPGCRSRRPSRSLIQSAVSPGLRRADDPHRVAGARRVHGGRRDGYAAVEREEDEVGRRVATEDARLVHHAVGGRHLHRGRRADEAVAREDLVGQADANPRPRRVPDLSRTLTATTERPTAIATACALTMGVLVGTASCSFAWSLDRPSAPTAPRTARCQDGARRARDERGRPYRPGSGRRGGRRRSGELGQLARVEPEPVERVGRPRGAVGGVVVAPVVGGGLAEGLVVVLVARVTHEIECNDGIRRRGRARGRPIRPARAGLGTSFRTLFAVRTPPNDSRRLGGAHRRRVTGRHVELVGRDAPGRGGGLLRRRRARSRRGPRGSARHDLRGLRGARASRDGRDRGRGSPPVARARADGAAPPRRRAGALGAFGRGRGLVAASRRGVRGRARYCIDALKESAPIWKQEHWTGGSDWARNEAAIKPVASSGRTSTSVGAGA